MVLLSYLSQVIWNEGDVIDSYEIKLDCAYDLWGVSSFVFHAIEVIVADKKTTCKTSFFIPKQNTRDEKWALNEITVKFLYGSGDSRSITTTCSCHETFVFFHREWNDKRVREVVCCRFTVSES